MKKKLENINENESRYHLRISNNETENPLKRQITFDAGTKEVQHVKKGNIIIKFYNWRLHDQILFLLGTL